MLDPDAGREILQAVLGRYSELRWHHSLWWDRRVETGKFVIAWSAGLEVRRKGQGVRNESDRRAWPGGREEGKWWKTAWGLGRSIVERLMPPGYPA